MSQNLTIFFDKIELMVAIVEFTVAVVVNMAVTVQLLVGWFLSWRVKSSEIMSIRSPADFSKFVISIMNFVISSYYFFQK